MSLSRPFLAPNHSFSTSTPTAQVERPLKRRASAIADFAIQPMQTSNSSFRPLLNQRSMHSVTVPGPTQLPAPPLPRQQTNALDPSIDDPTAVFLHPPFEAFINNPEHPDGLTYLVLADHPDWFLDSRDYNALNNDNPNAIPYPPQLEPPRGWCPAKKKDLKQLGADGWPEGEEPRLRCTFCRRTYAGVNAKSMWRRHVYEKHKIAMANRREGTERVRGRNSNKENKRSTSLSESGFVESVSQQEHFSREEPTIAKAKLPGSMQPPQAVPTPHEPVSEHPPLKLSMDEFLDSGARKREHRARPSPRTSTPPPSHASHDTAGPVLAMSTPKEANQSQGPLSSTPLRTRAIPESPYNPLATPAFRHSPARLPSDQPWRFPSPSHPLHSAATELTLASVVRGEMSPRTPGVGIDFSPVVIGPTRRTPMSSPSVSIFGMKARAQPDLGIFEGGGHERLPWGGLGGLLSGKATPRRLFSTSSLRLSTPGSSMNDLSDTSGDSSHCFSDITDGSSLLEPPIQLAGESDPFSLLGTGKDLSPPTSLIDGESPIIRRSLTMPPPLAAAGVTATPSRLKASWSVGQIYDERSSDEEESDSDDDREDDAPPKLRYAAADDRSDDGEREDDSLSEGFGADQWHSDDFEQLDMRPTKRLKLSA